jgi:catechol 2,3-dioxygenase-like lactoylglutathione lyase family enzyme
MTDFGIRASNLFLYYEDLEKAHTFYTRVLGMELVADYGMAKILRVSKDAYLILVDATKGMHTAKEPKTVALALLTDQLSDWYAYLKRQNVDIKYDYKPKTGNAHDGFVVIDPEGYLLEFETFKQHPENEKFIPILDQNETIFPKDEVESVVPKGLGFKSAITWLYYKDLLSMQKFYEEVLGLELVVDQGWAKIYQVSETGFIGLVDERRGMHQFTDKKAVNISFIIDDLQSWFDHVQSHNLFELRSNEVSTGPETRYKAFVGYDPEGYFMEFDRFFPHQDNSVLLDYLKSEL